ncbi:MAG: septal ring lytic transglycosylase RlpA family lipoprotein [Desulfuromonas sp.]|uniref:septal ring lytic transglycosylase RlpA family protein n=1 Tax=Desulfuromonas sp. TaxID=892 RepID=UPI000CA9D51E|nr:septal ring lytic transglycosylase RlpA family protein [Desulfuromonas sp.]PLX86006.1 MAG: septal ring lytic transglycosylase RlpA family lipoprotein [Desulfuromonas sp.]
MSLKRIYYSFLLLFLALLLGACGGYRTRVIDTPENSHLKGHQKPYTVNGERYEPMLRSEGFVQEGGASWYGEKFHGRKTSNGEIYDMYAMTAAHKTLPLGVTVKVRHLGSGKETEVRVNDRGPFVKGRIIDLSLAAATKLGVVGPGTAPVRIEALGFRQIGEAGKVEYRRLDSYDSGPFAIQVGAFGVAANAERLRADLEGRYGVATVEQERVGGTLFHRVRVGRYESLLAADQARASLAAAGHGNGFVVAID